MSREFRIVASNFETCFTMKCGVDGAEKTFSSLFEAARHVRATPGWETDVMVIIDESGKAMSRIPFNL